jgi:hypothetical protein
MEFFVEFIVISSFIVTLFVLVLSAIKSKTSIEEKYRQGVVFAFGILFFGAIFGGDKALTNGFFFSLSATFMVIIIADPYLVRNTLSYGGNSWEIIKTPYWMAALWVVVLTQLCYIWAFIEPRSAWELDKTFFKKWLLFIVIGFTIFFVFELVASNYTKWWSRKNCKKILGEVPLYALGAELATVMTLPIIFSYAIGVSIWAALIWGIFMGIAIGIYFCVSCKTHKEKWSKLNQKTERN